MGKITKIEQQKKNKSRYSIYIDEEFAFGISEDTLIKNSLIKNQHLDNETIEKVILVEEQHKANEYAIKLLSFKMRTEKEVRRKMKEKEYTQEQIEKTIEYLYSFKYLDDEKYARLFMKDSVYLKKMGVNRIKQELYSKGIDSNVIKEVIEDLKDEDEEYTNALELASKKLNSSYKNDDRNKQYRKLSSFLQRKGYGYELVAKVLKEVL